MWNLGSATLDKAVTVKLTRTLAIIPITLFLAFLRTEKEEKEDKAEGKKVSLKQIFPFFILYFIAASIITTVAVQEMCIRDSSRTDLLQKKSVLRVMKI